MVKDIEFKIVEMKPEDVTAIKIIDFQSGLSNWSEQDYLIEIKRPDSVTKIVRYRKKIIGFIVARLITSHLGENVDTAEIYNIAVINEFQKNGIGSLLLNNLIEICTDNRISEIWLEVRKSNAIARKFYGLHGFELITERKNYYSKPLEDAIIMMRAPRLNKEKMKS